MAVKIVLDNESCLPYRKHTYDAGFDLRSKEETFTLKPGDKKAVGTGVRIAIPKKYVGIVVPRSGLGTKFEVSLANTVGVIDHGYTGEIIVFLKNRGEDPVEIQQYDRFCQIIILPIYVTNLLVVPSLPATVRGDSGFGNSGVK